MPEFTASDPGSSFPNQNILFNSASGITGQQIQQNQLGIQQKQLELTAADHEQVGRLAAGLLNEPDPVKRADLYARGVGMLQSQGLAKYAPPTLPDESTLRSLVSQTIPAQTQAEWLQNLTANKAYTSAGNTGSTAAPGSTPGTLGTAAAPSTIEPTALTSATAVRDGLIKRGMDPVTATAFAANKLHESGATLDSGPGDGGVSQGNFMWNGDRNTEYQQLYGHTPQGAPLDEQLDFVMHELNGKESNARDAINAAQGVDGKAAAISRYYLRPKDVVGETQRRAATALQLQQRLASTPQPGAPGGATAPGVAMGDPTRPDLAPPPPGGTAGIPSPYQATGGGIGAVLGGTARAARPAGAPIVTDQPAGGGVVAGPAGTAVVGQPTPPSAAVPGNVSAINAGIARAGGAPAQAVTPEPGWGTVIGSYGPQNQLTPPPPAPASPSTAAAPVQPGQPGVRQPPQPPQPPPAAPLPPPPQMPVLNANGLTDIQQRQVNALAANPQNKQPAVAAAQQAFVNQNIQLRQQAFSDYMQQQQLAVQQGTLSNAQAELNLKTWQAAHPVPTSPRPIQGTASWDADAKQWVPATPGQPAVQGVWAYNNQGRGEFQPAAGVPAQGAYENMKTAYSGDVPTIKAISESGRTAQASALQLNELADVIKGVQSGGILPEFRAKVAALMEANGAKPETIQAMTGMSSGSDAQVLQKLAVATIGASAKSDLGSNVGVESLNLYAGANPGLDKLQDANKRVTNMIRVAREQIDSYSLGAQQHFNQNQTSMLHTPQGQVPDYHPLSEYNEKWQAQNNPQIGAAAIGILNGDGFDKWAARAGPEEALNAVRLAARIDPNIQIPVKGGGFKTAQEVLSHGAGQ